MGPTRSFHAALYIPQADPLELTRRRDCPPIRLHRALLVEESTTESLPGPFSDRTLIAGAPTAHDCKRGYVPSAMNAGADIALVQS